MNGPDRYRTLQGRAPEGAEEEQLGFVEGIDPVTGLPVLIYDFDGEPVASPGELESDNIPRILWSGSDEGRGRVVSALTPGWARRAEGSGPLTLGQLLAAAAALRAAAAAEVPHGDLTPQRLLEVGDHFQVEGYGVPWRPRPGPFRAPEITAQGTLAGDVWSLAKVVDHLGLEGGDGTVAAVLEQCTADDPLDRPSAEELYLALESLIGTEAAGGSPVGGTEEPGKPRAEKGEEEGDASPAAALPETTEHGSGGEKVTPVAGDVGATRGDHDLGAPKVTGVSVSTEKNDAESGHASEGAGNGDEAEPGEVPARSKRLPEEPGERRRRLTLLGALMAAVVILALLALYGPRGSEPPAAAPLEDVVYVVEVEVLPDDLPPVTIHLISSPEGSSLTRRDTIGTAPRHLALDRPGTWAFQGSLQGQRSEVVEIEVPEERTVTLVMPRTVEQ